MKRLITLLIIFAMLAALAGCASNAEERPTETADLPAPSISVEAIPDLPEDFVMGADISSLLSLEAAGRVFYGYEGKEQDLLQTLSQSGVNYIRVRVWNDPFDEAGNGYGGGNCTLDTAIELGKRAARYGMGLLVDFHYSDFWADPGKQQPPKAWAGMTLAEKSDAIYDYTKESIGQIKSNGISVGMVQVGNETTGGLCGEWEKEGMYTLMKRAADGVRDADEKIRIAVHYTNPEKQGYGAHAQDLKDFGVDYDIFATSYYPQFHGSVENLRQQLKAVQDISGKQVMIAETSWDYSTSEEGAYRRSVQGQADAIADCVRTMAALGGVGVFYWEPAWIDVPGESPDALTAIREQHGAGWASSFAGSYDPEDAGRYYGGTACIPSALFDPEGHPLESLKTFYYLRHGSGVVRENYIRNPSFEETDCSMWKITEAVAGTVGVQQTDARDGQNALHFWSDQAVSFTAEQTVTELPEGEYAFSVNVQGDGAGERAVLVIYALSGGTRYEQRFTLNGWCSWRLPVIEHIPCGNGEMTVGIEIRAAAGAWGTVDRMELLGENG